MTNISNKVKELRESRGLSLKQLGEKTNINKSTLSNYEHNRAEPSRKNAVKLANFFDVPLLYLMGYDDATLNNTLENASEAIFDIMRKLGLIPDDFEQQESLNESVKLIKGLSHENNEKWLEYGNLLLKSQSKK